MRKCHHNCSWKALKRPLVVFAALTLPAMLPKKSLSLVYFSSSIYSPLITSVDNSAARRRSRYVADEAFSAFVYPSPLFFLPRHIF